MTARLCVSTPRSLSLRFSLLDITGSIIVDWHPLRLSSVLKSEADLGLVECSDPCERMTHQRVKVSRDARLSDARRVSRLDATCGISLQFVSSHGSRVNEQFASPSVCIDPVLCHFILMRLQSAGTNFVGTCVEETKAPVWSSWIARLTEELLHGGTGENQG